MKFTVTNIARSLADHLAPVLPGVTMYEDPNQQDSRMPCMFLQQRYAYTEKQTGGYYLRRIGLDLTYLEDYNLPDLHRRYLAASEAVDLVMDTFPYQDGETGVTALVRAYNRESTIDLDAMHYKFEVRERVTFPDDGDPMETLGQNLDVEEAENG